LTQKEERKKNILKKNIPAATPKGGDTLRSEQFGVS
jgi:hypothetical protein